MFARRLPWILLANSEVAHFFRVFKSCTASYMMTSHPSKWSHRIWQGWGFSRFPLECANVDFVPGFLPKTSSGKNLYCLNPLPFITSSPPPFSLFLKKLKYLSVKSVTAQVTSKILACVWGLLFQTQNLEGLFHPWSTIFRNFKTSYFKLLI